MGVDISGRNPKTEVGDYFASNWWGWRPINYICQLAAEQSKLKIDFSHWGSNDGKGLRTQKQCDKLADALEKLLGNDFNLKGDDDRIYLCLGAWCEFGTGRFIGTEKMILMFPMIIGVTNELKKQNIVMNGFLSNFFLFLNCIVTLPMWYFLTIKEFFQKRKK